MEKGPVALQAPEVEKKTTRPLLARGEWWKGRKHPQRPWQSSKSPDWLGGRHTPTPHWEWVEPKGAFEEEGRQVAEATPGDGLSVPATAIPATSATDQGLTNFHCHLF